MADDSNFSAKALPTQGGTYSAWQPEFQSGSTDLTPDGWRPIPTVHGEGGIPGDRHCDGLNSTIGMCGYAQANALAWAYAAECEYRTGKRPEIRVVEYRVVYDIKCYRQSPGNGAHP